MGDVKKKLSYHMFNWLPPRFSDALFRSYRLLTGRNGDYSRAFEVAEKRLLIAFLETTDFCNASCIMCGAKMMRRKRQVMPMDMYRRVVDEFAEIHGHTIMLSAFAEPLLDPFIVERVSYANDKNTFINIGFSTNGSLLTGEMYRMLAKSGLKSITVSIDGFNKKSYEKIRVGLQYERIEQNILETLKVHKVVGAPISINISSFTRENYRELSRSNLYNALVDAGVKPGLKWRVDNWGGNISGVGGGLRLMNLPRRKGPCALLYDSSVLVLPDGRVTPCHCRDLEGYLFIGQISKHPLLKIWQGESLKEFREEQKKGIFRGPCEMCSAYTPIKKLFTKSVVAWLMRMETRLNKIPASHS